MSLRGTVGVAIALGVVVAVGLTQALFREPPWWATGAVAVIVTLLIGAVLASSVGPDAGPREAATALRRLLPLALVFAVAVVAVPVVGGWLGIGSLELAAPGVGVSLVGVLAGLVFVEFLRHP